jgi:hypothetical protein
METSIQGTPAELRFTSEKKEFILYGIIPEDWRLENEDGLVVLSKDPWEINISLIDYFDQNEDMLPNSSKLWFIHLLNDFIPNDQNYPEIYLSAFTIEGLKDTYTYSALIIDESGSEYLREDIIVIDTETPLRIKGFGENTDGGRILMENFILSLRYQPYEV